MNVIFTHKGKEFIGDLSQVQGAGSSAMYHLMINKYYRGCLRISMFDNRWLFDGEFAELAEAFGALILKRNHVQSGI
jgi:hypothetical protein